MEAATMWKWEGWTPVAAIIAKAGLLGSVPYRDTLAVHATDMRAQLLETLKGCRDSGSSRLDAEETSLYIDSLTVGNHEFADFDALFDALDVYNTVEHLTVVHPGIDSLPVTLVRFQRLKTLAMSGSQLSHVDLDRLPEDLESFKAL